MNSQATANSQIVPDQPEPDRYEKGSAMRLIAEDNEAVESKSSRLKALRLQRDAELAAKPKEKPKAKRTKAVASRKAAPVKATGTR